MAGYYPKGSGSYRDDDDNKPDNSLVFPINVHDSLQASSGLKHGEKLGIMVSFWALACGLLAWFLAGWLRTLVPHYYGWITLLVIVVLQLTLGVYLLRFAMDETAVFSEMNSDDCSFANYFSIYKERVYEEGSMFPFDMIEFADGSYGVYIQLKLGYNTQVRSNNTYEANKEVISLLDKSRMPHAVFYTNEHFRNSKVTEELMQPLKTIEDPRLFKTYRDIVQGLLTIAEEESNVPCATYVIWAQNRISKDELPSLVNQVLLALGKEDTVYRDLSILSYPEIVEFYRNYYKLEVLDMGLIRAHAALKKKLDCTVKAVKLYGKSGKIYVTDDFKGIQAQILGEFGLKEAKKIG